MAIRKSIQALIAIYLIAVASASTFVGVYFSNKDLKYNAVSKPSLESEYIYDPSWNPNAGLYQSAKPLGLTLRHQPPPMEFVNIVDDIEPLDELAETYLPIEPASVELSIKQVE